MPKKPPRDNPPYRDRRTVQSAATLLQRISQKAGVVVRPPGGPEAAATRLDEMRALLPQALRPHVLGILEKADELVLFVDSAAWAARLKLALAESPLAGSRRTVVRLAAPDLVRRA